MEPINLDETLVGEMMDKSRYIAENLTQECLYEHIAEEAAEVAHAALKCARVLRAENPTPLEYEKALKDLEEEWTDLDLVVDILNEESLIENRFEHLAIDDDLYREKLNRWYYRVKEACECDKEYFVDSRPNIPNDDELYKSSADALRESINRNQEIYFRTVYSELCKKYDIDSYDPVNHPSHYCREGSSIETLDAIEASMTPEEFKGYLKGNAEKYIWRYDMKGHAIQDLQKAIFYLNKLIEVLGKEEK